MLPSVSSVSYCCPRLGFYNWIIGACLALALTNDLMTLDLMSNDLMSLDVGVALEFQPCEVVLDAPPDLFLNI